MFEKKKFPVETTTQNVTDGPSEGRGRSDVGAALRMRATTALTRGRVEDRDLSAPPAHVTVRPTVGYRCRIGGKSETAAARPRARKTKKTKSNKPLENVYYCAVHATYTHETRIHIHIHQAFSFLSHSRTRIRARAQRLWPRLLFFLFYNIITLYPIHVQYYSVFTYDKCINVFIALPPPPRKMSSDAHSG